MVIFMAEEGMEEEEKKEKEEEEEEEEEGLEINERNVKEMEENLE